MFANSVSQFDSISARGSDEVIITDADREVCKSTIKSRKETLDRIAEIKSRFEPLKEELKKETKKMAFHNRQLTRFFELWGVSTLKNRDINVSVTRETTEKETLPTTKTVLKRVESSATMDPKIRAQLISIFEELKTKRTVKKIVDNE